MYNQQFHFLFLCTNTSRFSKQIPSENIPIFPLSLNIMIAIKKYKSSTLVQVLPSEKRMRCCFSATWSDRANAA